MTRHSQAARAVEDFIAEFDRRTASGALPPGARLESERTLTARYGIARNTLRRGLDTLESQGRILRIAGKGAFVAEPPARDGRAGLGPLIDRLARESSPSDVLDAQAILEPRCASLIVARAADDELKALEPLLQGVEQARNIAEFEHWNGRLHRAMIAASHNALLIALFELVDGLRHDTIWGALKRNGRNLQHRKTYEKQHREIVLALRARDARTAAMRMQLHVETVRAVLLGH